MGRHLFRVGCCVACLVVGGCTRSSPPPDCADFVKNGDETDVDCGGSCAPCPLGKGCAVISDCLPPATCTAKVCILPTCTDRVKNGTETDIDCGGGACATCQVGQACQHNQDCATGNCSGAACAVPTCSDGFLNGSESDVDCGGSCPVKCAIGRKCGAHVDCASGVCSAGLCGAPSCTDSMQNGDETDIDCGGSCDTKCADGKKCVVTTDCSSKLCAAGFCAPITCTNGTKDGTESDIDCGGLCPAKCAGGKKCVAATDCASKICAAGLCTTAACTDQVLNGDESDVDCGGVTCPKCGDNKTCAVSGDCLSAVCIGKVCQAPSCNDGVKNGGESDVDCGATCAVKCATGKKCAKGADCAAGVCTPTTLTCAAPTCADLVKNGTETDVDCGGTCAKKCAAGKACLVAADCVVNLSCVAGLCVDTCADKIKDGTETDVDCGGTCPAKCADGKGCKVAADCLYQQCVAGFCFSTCTNKVKDGTETDVDCGGTCLTKCADGKGCKTGADCTSQVCAGAPLLCQVPSCSDGVQNGGEDGIDCGGPCAACGGTCPMLYTNDGTTLQFESDMFPRGMLGIQYATGYFKPNPNDYYVLRHTPAAGPDGLLDLRLIEERFEVDYLDQARLYAIDAAPGLDVYAEILYTGTSYVPPGQVVHTVALPLNQAVSAKHVDTGQDVTATLASPDGQVLVLGTDRNNAAWNTLELDLGNQATAPRIKLVVEARSMMPTTLAGQQKASSLELPGAMRTLLQVRDATGAWVTVPKATASLPIPKELPRPFVLDITSIFVADRQKVRLGFLYKTYVDAIRFDTTVDQPVSINEVPLAKAALGYHGVDMPADSSEMTLYVYGKLYPVRPYSYFPGLYTAFTDVTALLKSIDDMFVIFGPGDEVSLGYGPEPAKPAGATRRYLFYTNGYYKSDKATTISWTVAPLPFAAMSNFPYDPAVESYPTDAGHQSYLSTYNTRQQ